MSTFVSLRLNDEELKDLNEHAAASGLSRSAYLRLLIRLAPKFESVEIGDLDPDDHPGAIPTVLVCDYASMKNELRMQGTNLNQSTKSMNILSKEIHQYDEADAGWYFNLLRKEFANLKISYGELVDAFEAHTSLLSKLDGDGRVRP